MHGKRHQVAFRKMLQITKINLLAKDKRVIQVFHVKRGGVKHSLPIQFLLKIIIILRIQRAFIILIFHFIIFSWIPFPLH